MKNKSASIEQVLLFKKAVSDSDIPTLELMVKEGFKVSSVAWESISHAVTNGDVKMLEFFHRMKRNIFAFNNALLVLAVQKSQFEVVKYFVGNGAKLAESPMVLTEAYKKKDFAIANYLMGSDPKLLSDKRIVSACARFSEMQGLKLLVENGADCDVVSRYLMPRLKKDFDEYLKIKEEKDLLSDDLSLLVIKRPGMKI